MESGRPLREAFTELLGDETARQAYTADPDGFLEAYGHADLPDSLIAEALVNFADTAPAAVAEHLAPFVMGHSVVPVEHSGSGLADPASGLDLLATAPIDADLGDVAAGTDVTAGLDEMSVVLDGATGEPPPRHVDAATADLGFGTGSASAREAPAEDAPALPTTDAPDAYGGFDVGEPAGVTDAAPTDLFAEPAPADRDGDGGEDGDGDPGAL